MRDPASSFAAFARAIHSLCPKGKTIDLAAATVARERGFCGEHGRVLPTRQNLCPRCGGYVEKETGMHGTYIAVPGADELVAVKEVVRKLKAATEVTIADEVLADVAAECRPRGPQVVLRLEVVKTVNVPPHRP